MDDHLADDIFSAESMTRRKPGGMQRSGHHEPRSVTGSNTSQSPSRRSPKSPPRSPSWMRHHRDSPPRSPPHRLISPSISPTERFPDSAYNDKSVRSVPGSSSQFPDRGHVEEYEIRLDDGHEFEFNAMAELGGVPPKPARMGNDVFRMPPGGNSIAAGADFDHGILNVASFAAAIANDTAHLTRMSVSPMDAMPVKPLAETFPDQPSVNFDRLTPTVAEQSMKASDVSDPTPKVIDYQNARRQKAKPPTSGADWSPISDLSPIIDVSPSVERVEQDHMIGRTGDGGSKRGSAVTDSAMQRRALPNTPAARMTDSKTQLTEENRVNSVAETIRGNEMYQVLVEGSTQSGLSQEDEIIVKSSLKRCPRFEDITVISSVADGTAKQEMLVQQQSNIAATSSVMKLSVSDASKCEKQAIRDEQSVGAVPRVILQQPSERQVNTDRQGTSMQVDVDFRDSSLRKTELTALPQSPASLTHQVDRDSAADSRLTPAQASKAKRRLPSVDGAADPTSSAAVKPVVESPVPENGSCAATTPSSMESPSTSVESNAKKQRRRLPPVPVELGSNISSRRLRSRSADSRVNDDETNAEKERLRRHLRLKEVSSSIIS